MTKINHTEGPWINGSDGYGLKVMSITENEAICCFYMKGERYFVNAKANAHLISAAPDMLDALENVNKLIAKCAISGFTDKAEIEALFLSQRETTKTIKKAKGELT